MNKIDLDLIKKYDFSKIMPFFIPLILFFAYKIFDYHFMFENDVINFLYPKLTIIKMQLLNGHFPFWNRYEGFGTPLFSEAAVPFFESFLLFFLSVKDTIVVSAIIHIFLSMLFFYYFMRNIGVSSKGSVIASVIWTLNGYHLWYINDLSILGINLFFPLIMLCIIKFYNSKKTILWILIASLALFFQFIYKRPTDLMYGLIFVFFFCFYMSFFCNEDRSIQKSSIHFSKALMFLSIMFFLGLLLSAFITLPFFDHLLKSHRFGVGDRMETNYRGSVLDLFFPSFGPALQNIFSFLPRLGRLHSKGFFGIVSIPFLIIALKTKNIYKNFFIVTMIVFFVMQFPIYLFDLLRFLPLHGGAVEPIRFFPFFMFSVAVLVGIGYDKFFKDEMLVYKIKSLVNKRKLIIILFFALFAVGIIISTGFTFFLKYSTWEKAGKWSAYLGLIWSWCAVWGISIFTLIFVYFFKVRKLSYNFSFYILITVLILTFCIVNRADVSDGDLIKKNNYILNYFPKREWVKKMQEESQSEYFRIGDEFYMESSWPRLLIESASFYSATVNRSVVEYYLKLLKERSRTSPSIENIGSFFYDLANVRYFAVKDDQVQKYSKRGFKVIYHDDEKGSAILKNIDAFPRCFFVSKFKVIKDDNETIQYMLNMERKNKDWFKSNVILSEDVGKMYNHGEKNNVELMGLTYGDSSVSFKVKALKPCIMFFSDFYNPDWIVETDNNFIKIIKADFLFRAVTIPKGFHDIKLVYKSRFFNIGLKFSLVGLFIFILLFLSTIFLYFFNKEI